VVIFLIRYFTKYDQPRSPGQRRFAVLLPYYKWTSYRAILTWLKLGWIAELASDSFFCTAVSLIILGILLVAVYFFVVGLF